MIKVYADSRDISWMPRAACLGQDPLIYDTDDEMKPSGQILCFLCPVRAECLTYALAGRESGTWGGMSRKQRDSVASRKRKRRRCPDTECRSTQIYNAHGVGSCVACGVSWHIESRKNSGQAQLNPVGV